MTAADCAWYRWGAMLLEWATGSRDVQRLRDQPNVPQNALRDRLDRAAVAIWISIGDTVGAGACFALALL